MRGGDWRLEWQRLRRVRPGEITLEEGGSWPLLLRILVCTLIALIFAVGALWFFALPRADQVEQADARVEELMSQYATRSFQAANLPLLEERMATLEARMAELVDMLPTDTEMAALLDDISEAARRQQLDIDYLRLGTPQPQPFYVIQPFDIQVRGGYHQLAEFVARVAALPRIVTLHDMTLVPADGDGLVLTIAAETYRYEPESGSDDEGGA
ncbi:type 4a pilus biogenesis protein PilO [Kushneria aurantia]|uniref:Type 4a pilus biogenesis protein PilO n=1 Tax=Kushneria aurantia TaxID=504092 RepID=A0ABV6FZD5_9GAMM|nr:type 4a pilus biogenesis protein PilO [Kushneria aurantia]